MKKIILVIAIGVSLLHSVCFAQCNWYLQNIGTANELRSVFFINQSTGWVAGFYGTILTTTNGGNNWALQNSGYDQGLVTLFFINNLTGWAGGGHQYLSGAILKTTNGGTNWNSVYTTDIGMIYKIFFVNSNTGFASADYGWALKTTNGGLNWSSKNLGTNRSITNCQFVNQNTGWVNGDFGTIMKSTDGGDIWIQQNSGTTENLEGIFFLNSNTGFITGFNGIIIKTTDGGANWNAKQSGSTNWLNSVFFVNDITGWIVGGVYPGTVSQILRTCNAGENWSVISSPANSWLADVKFIDINTGWAVGRNGALLKTTSGASYIPQAPVLFSPPDNSSVSSLTPALVWNLSQCAAGYKVQISLSSNFNSIIDSSTTTINQYTVPAGKLVYDTRYYWRTNASNSAGTGQWSSVWSFTPQPIGINPVSSEIPYEFSLSLNYPNPFNPSTKINFDIPKQSDVKIIIYDIVGHEVATLVNEKLNPGVYEVEWDAADYSSGIYFYRLVTSDFVDTKKMVIIK